MAIRPIAVIDSSCVIALDILNLLPALSVLFNRLLLPKAVRQELNQRQIMKDRVEAYQNEYATFVIFCDQYDQGAVDVLLSEKKRLGKKDRGETEAVVQAAMEGAMVIIDDRDGRRLALQQSVDCHGTIWILEQLRMRDLLRPLTLRQCFVELRSREIRFPGNEANRLLQSWGEDPL